MTGWDREYLANKEEYLKIFDGAMQQEQEQNVEFLEKSLTKITGRKYAVACSSGTDALHFALISLGIKPGDEVLTTQFSWIATASCISMVGATTTIAEGIYAVGYNPALLAFQKDKPFMLQLGGLDFGIGNDYISMAGMSALSGATLENDDKTFIINRLQNRGGLAFNVNGQIALPGINFTSGNMALTSNIMYFSSYAIPAGMARLMLEGNASNPVIDMTFGYEIMAVNESAFSFAICSCWICKFLYLLSRSAV